MKEAASESAEAYLARFPVLNEAITFGMRRLLDEKPERPLRALAGLLSQRSREFEHLGVGSDDIFAAADADSDGVLTRDELTASLRARRFDDLEIKQFLAAVDENGDGVVTRDEWRAAFRRGLPTLVKMVPQHAATFATLRGGAERTPAMDTARRGITLRQLRALRAHVAEHCVRDAWTDVNEAPLTPERVNLYDMLRYVIKPATHLEQCSYVEYVASDAAAQSPRWFVSHWWGHPFEQTLACLEQHAADHGYDDEMAYWVCAFAINQHDVSDDVRIDPSESPFAQVIAC